MSQLRFLVSTWVTLPYARGSLHTFIDSSSTLLPSTNTLRRTGRIEFSKTTENPTRKKKDASSPVLGHTRRKPTLIRHLGGHSGPKGEFEQSCDAM